MSFTTPSTLATNSNLVLLPATTLSEWFLHLKLNVPLLIKQSPEVANVSATGHAEVNLFRETLTQAQSALVAVQRITASSNRGAIGCLDPDVAALRPRV